MVSIPSIVCMCIALLLTTLVPIGIMIWYCIRHKDEKVWLAALIGAAGFFVPQMLIRIPILNALSMNEGFMAFAENHYLIYGISLAATAGLFELAGRFTTAKILNGGRSGTWHDRSRGRGRTSVHQQHSVCCDDQHWNI